MGHTTIPHSFLCMEHCASNLPSFECADSKSPCIGMLFVHPLDDTNSFFHTTASIERLYLVLSITRVKSTRTTEYLNNFVEELPVNVAYFPLVIFEWSC